MSSQEPAGLTSPVLYGVIQARSLTIQALHRDPGFRGEISNTPLSVIIAKLHDVI